MFNAKTLFIGLLGMFIALGSAMAQNINVNFRLLNPAIQTLYVSDLDLLQQGIESGTAEPIFEITVDAPGFDPANDGEIYENCRMLVSLHKDDNLLASWNSNYFRIPENPVPYRITNDVLVNGRYAFDPAISGTAITFSETEISDYIDKLQNDILASGKLPVGNYTLEINLSYNNLQNPQGGIVTEDKSFTFLTATNPSYIQLVAPGVVAGGGEPQTIFSEFPVFQWTGNGDQFQVLVFEKRNADQTVDDVINSRENWHSEPLSVQSALYPQGGEVIPLEYGKTYFWMVKMLVSTSSGTEEVNSEVWQFKLADPADQNNQQAALSKNEIMTFLRDLLGDRAEEIAKSLEDYEVATIRVNGSDISIQELYNLINTYRGSEVEVQDLILPGTLN